MSAAPRTPRRGRAPVGSAAIALVGVAVAVPVLAVASRALRPEGSWGTDALVRILSSARTWRIVAVTVAQAGASSALALGIGVPVAWVLVRYRFRGVTALRTATTVPFVLPSVVIGTAFASILGPQGIVDLRGTWWPILAAHTCFNLAVVIRSVGAALASSPPDLEAAGRLLGASRLGVFRRLVLPSIAPALAASGVIVFLFCLTSFGVIVILGGGAVTTVEVEIWTRATRQFDLSGAGVLAMLQLAAVLATLALHSRISRRARRQATVSLTPRSRPVSSPGERLAVIATAGAVLVVSVAPLVALLERSVRVGDSFTLEHWRHLGSATAGTGLAVSPLSALATSAVTALTATVLAVVVAVPASRAAARAPGGIGDRILLLPLGVSATTIGLGLLLAVGRPPVDLRRSWWTVPVAQALVATPLIVRSVLPALRTMPASVLDVAATLGLGASARWWRVELPVVRRAAVAGAGLGLVACLGEFGATVFVARAASPTVPVAIARLMSRPGGAGFGQAMALSFLLALCCAAVVWAVDRWLGGEHGAGPTF